MGNGEKGGLREKGRSSGRQTTEKLLRVRRQPSGRGNRRKLWLCVIRGMPEKWLLVCLGHLDRILCPFIIICLSVLVPVCMRRTQRSALSTSLQLFTLNWLAYWCLSVSVHAHSLTCVCWQKTLPLSHSAYSRETGSP